MFTVLAKEGKARRGRFETPHGIVETPVFMNVGTQAAIKGGLSSFDLEQIGCQVMLSNTYHLHLRPGEEIIRELGGLHRFTAWNRPILTDSGGFQVFSLTKTSNISEEGVVFNSHIDGRRIFMGPEDSIRIQSALSSDIAMAFDECVGNPCTYDYAEQACDRTLRWLKRCIIELKSQNEGADVINPGQMLFGINQGGVFGDLRINHMQQIVELDLPGYAIGGLAVGESTQEMYNMIETVEPFMPQEKPRYLMGVGTPGNIIESVARGIDFFDCVLPARNARHAHLYTRAGCMNLKNEKYKNDGRPVDETCSCPVCKRYSRAYLRHLFKAEEILALRLGVLHNLYFFNNMMSEIRTSIEAGSFNDYKNLYSDVFNRRI